MNNPPIANSQSSGNCSENMVWPSSPGACGDRANDGAPAADRTEDDHVDGRYDRHELRRHEADLMREDRSAQRRHGGRDTENEHLEVGHVVAGETGRDPPRRDGNQHYGRACWQDEAARNIAPTSRTQQTKYRIYFALSVRMSQPKMRARISDAIDAAGTALPGDDQDGPSSSARLG